MQCYKDYKIVPYLPNAIQTIYLGHDLGNLCILKLINSAIRWGASITLNEKESLSCVVNFLGLSNMYLYLGLFCSVVGSD